MRRTKLLATCALALFAFAPAAAAPLAGRAGAAPCHPDRDHVLARCVTNRRGERQPVTGVYGGIVGPLTASATASLSPSQVMASV